MRAFLPAVLSAAALLLTASSTQAAGNFAFAVPAGPGLDLTITGYDSGGDQLFSVRNSTPEPYNNAPHYIIRVHEDLVMNGQVARWCVEDASGNWSELPRDNPAAQVCDDKPRETRGTYLFTARGVYAPAPKVVENPPVSPVAVDIDMDEPEAIACVQAELNSLGYDAGPVDGQAGRKTRSAVDGFAGALTVPVALPPLDVKNAGQWCVAIRSAVSAGNAVSAGDAAFSFRFGPDVTASVRSDTAKVIPQIADFFRTQIGYALEKVPTIYVSSDAAWLADAYLVQRRLGQGFRRGKLEDFERCNGGEAGYRFIFMCAKSNVFSGDWFGLTAVAQRKFGLTHEYFHMIQFELAGERTWKCCTGEDSVPLVGPQWLVEGSAEYMAFVILKQGGWSGSEREIDWHTQQSRSSGKLPSQLVSRKQYYAEPLASSTGMIAAHLLANDAGFEAFPRFWSAMASGERWPAAFERAFRMTPAAFDERFQAALR